MIRVGLLGAGKIGQIHAQAYQKIPGVAVSAVCDANQAAAEALANKLGARAFIDIDSLLEHSSIDMVDVSLPTFLHERCVTAAAQHGHHVFCEKPICLTLEGAERMIAAVQSAGVKSMIGQVVRFNPEYSAVRAKIAEGSIGKPRVVSATRRAEMPDWGAWFKDPQKSGGALFDLHIHDIDFVYSMFGLPTAVYAVGLQDTGGAWNHVMTSLTYRDCRAVIEASYLSPPGYPFQMGLRVLGDTGCIEYTYSGGQVDLRDQATRGVILYRAGQPGEPVPATGADGFLAELGYFAACIAGDEPVQIASFQQAYEVLGIIHATKRSLESGEAVKL